MTDTLESLRQEWDVESRSYPADDYLPRFMERLFLAAWKHDCNEWRMEGIGCAECNPTAAAIRDAWDDPVRRERDGLRSLLSEAEGENAHLREQVAALRGLVERIHDYYASLAYAEKYADVKAEPGDEWCHLMQRARDLLAQNTFIGCVAATDESGDWHVHEAKEAAKEEGV